MSEAAITGGPVRRWKEGKILYAENDIMRAAFVVSQSKHMIGCVGWYGNPGEPQVWVEFISSKDAAAWNGAVKR